MKRAQLIRAKEFVVNTGQIPEAPPGGLIVKVCDYPWTLEHRFGVFLSVYL